MTRRLLQLLTALILTVTAIPFAATAGGGMPKSVVKGEVLHGWVDADGRRTAALRLTLAPGWKTYWRAPGDAGIPPTFDWSNSDNLAGIRYHWPTPDVFDSYGMRTIGYQNELILPIELHPKRKGQPIRLRGAMDLGICESVCVPASLRFDAKLGGKGGSDPLIHAALADRPIPAKRAGVGRVTCQLDPISDGLRLTAKVSMPRLAGSEIALVEAPDPRIWVSEPMSHREGQALLIEADLVPPAGKPIALDRSGLRFTVLGRAQAVDIRGCTGG